MHPKKVKVSCFYTFLGDKYFNALYIQFSESK